MSNLKNDILKASELHFKSHIEKHKVNVKVLLDRPVGVAEHPDLLDTIEKELDQIAHYHDKLEMIRLYFGDDEKSFLQE